MHYLRSGGARAAAVVAANATFPAVLLVVDGYPDPDPDGRPDLGAHAHARPIRGRSGRSGARWAGVAAGQVTIDRLMPRRPQPVHHRPPLPLQVSDGGRHINLGPSPTPARSADTSTPACCPEPPATAGPPGPTSHRRGPAAADPQLAASRAPAGAARPTASSASDSSTSSLLPTGYPLSQPAT